MRAIEQSGVSSATFPVLELFAIDPSDGLLKDVFSATWDIVDPTGAAAGPVAVGLVADRISLGRYAAAWSVPVAQPVGINSIVWIYDFVSGGPSYTLTRTFEVLKVGEVENPLANMYTTTVRMRDEGVTTKNVKNAKLVELITLASTYVEMFTGNVFVPAGKIVSMDGQSASAILLDEPIIAVGDILIDTSPFFPSDIQIDASLFRVYNRHLSQGLLNPDDRDSPKIEFFHTSRDIEGSGGLASFSFDRLHFPHGQQNIHITGVFGYTQPNGKDLLGVTPQLISQATALLVVRNVEKLTKFEDREDIKRQHLKTEDRTRDQQIKWDVPSSRGAAFGAFTGDPEIDTILARFTKPVPIRAA